MRPDIEAASTTLDRARQTADPVEPLYHGRPGAVSHGLEGCRHAGRPAADDDQVANGSFLIHLHFLPA
jgi:hypothetical protein